MSEESVELVRLGRGTFACVYALEGRNNDALKIAIHANRNQEMEKEFQYLVQLLSVISSIPDTLFKVPAPLKYSTLSGRQSQMPREVFERLLDNHLIDCSLYYMERVWPIPENLARFIRRHYYPEGYKDYRRGFICRIYLGKKIKQMSNRFFNPLNFQLDAARLVELELDVNKIASEMGRLLAIIHFQTKHDGGDIEFILGGLDLKNPGFFCIDFNQIRLWENLSELVETFYLNDPYYPKPGDEFWTSFKSGYLLGAEGMTEVATEFIELITKRATSGRKPLVFSETSL